MPKLSSLSFQDSLSPLMMDLVEFHDFSMKTMVLIMALTMMAMKSTLFNKSMNQSLQESHLMEILWTITPGAILIVIALPSLRILYNMEEISNYMPVIKTMGYQWYWVYEIPYLSNNSESFLDKSLSHTNIFRLLDVDNRLVIPSKIKLVNMISANDVIHSWAVPSIGAKVDAVPGRLNQIIFLASSSGLLFGQCSEICGANHSFMPITMESIPSSFIL